MEANLDALLAGPTGRRLLAEADSAALGRFNAALAEYRAAKGADDAREADLTGRLRECTGEASRLRAECAAKMDRAGHMDALAAVAAQLLRDLQTLRVERRQVALKKVLTSGAPAVEAALEQARAWSSEFPAPDGFDLQRRGQRPGGFQLHQLARGAREALDQAVLGEDLGPSLTDWKAHWQSRLEEACRRYRATEAPPPVPAPATDDALGAGLASLGRPPIP